MVCVWGICYWLCWLLVVGVAIISGDSYKDKIVLRWNLGPQKGKACVLLFKTHHWVQNKII